MMAFFVSVIVLTLISYHPLILALSLGIAAASVLRFLGARVLLQTLVWLIPTAVVIIAFNTVFNRRGATELLSVQLGRTTYTFTLESFLFGASLALMLAAVILWFRLYQEFMTSDRFLYLFAPIAPTTALSISMVQRWIPLTKQRWTQIRNAEKMLPAEARGEDKGEDVKGKGTHTSFSFRRRRRSSTHFRALTRSLSALMSWSMEDAIEAADSMQARGYSHAAESLQKCHSVHPGHPDRNAALLRARIKRDSMRFVSKKRRTSFRAYRFTAHDTVSLVCIAVLALSAGITIFLTTRTLAFFPIFRGAADLPIFALAATALLMLYPLLLEGKEQLKWHLSARMN